MKKALFIICFALLSIGISFGSEPAQIVIPAQTTANNFVPYPTSKIYIFKTRHKKWANMASPLFYKRRGSSSNS